MKVLNLQCVAGHGFEGWFGSEADIADQQARGLLTCPVCSSHEIHRLPSAPRLNLSGAREPRGRAVDAARPSTAPTGQPGAALVAASATDAPAPPLTPEAAAHAAVMQAAYLHAVRELMTRTEDVGPRFAEEARRIHYGETEERQIRGKTTPDEAEALREEGIEFFSVALPDGMDGPVQ
ncbi:DUF1178 family protein [Sphaerotilus mobilis]|uniref:DUF1178 family protein n=1 Tax=Sphaerotilus mobilis TaxID=47994 RepID=A0A4Q7LTW0_9BURK|nr:DUF1178 family protein [Sphaerotilus mobilis]RZS58466.1 hypothetical protein EV685_0759 [Sphaerotilus mobilis]